MADSKQSLHEHVKDVMQSDVEISKPRTAKQIAEEKTRSEAEKRAVQLKRDIAHISALPEGIRFFRHMSEYCGYHLSAVVLNRTTGEALNSTLNNEALRGVYLYLRTLIPRKQLIEIEFPEPEDTDEMSNSEDN